MLKKPVAILFELNNQKSVVLYQAKQQKPFAPNTTIMGAVKQFNKADLGWNKLPTFTAVSRSIAVG